jgi:hypothetical protein
MKKFAYDQSVLVRDTPEDPWNKYKFAYYTTDELTDEFPYIVQPGVGWRECIPFVGNEKLEDKIGEPERQGEYK